MHADAFQKTRHHWITALSYNMIDSQSLIPRVRVVDRGSICYASKETGRNKYRVTGKLLRHEGHGACKQIPYRFISWKVFLHQVS